MIAVVHGTLFARVIGEIDRIRKLGLVAGPELSASLAVINSVTLPCWGCYVDYVNGNTVLYKYHKTGSFPIAFHYASSTCFKQLPSGAWKVTKDRTRTFSARWTWTSEEIGKGITALRALESGDGVTAP